MMLVANPKLVLGFEIHGYMNVRGWVGKQAIGWAGRSSSNGMSGTLSRKIDKKQRSKIIKGRKSTSSLKLWL